jgi:predicted 2-oxoglutarate/Fe(II)-dependent dioxygenase YbiX/peroxiredoxin
MRNLSPGDPAPWFKAPTSSRPDYNFAAAAGRYLAVAFVPSSRSEPGAALTAALAAHRPLFDDLKLAFFGVTADPADQAGARVKDDIPGVRWFYDAELTVSRRFGAVDASGDVVPMWAVFDPMLRAIAVGPMAEVAQMMRIVAGLPPAADHAGVEMTAPVLVMPRIFEPELCQTLIRHYQEQGGEPSGFMAERDGRTVLQQDRDHKRRTDCTLKDEGLRAACRERVETRLVPEIAKAFQFKATRMERYIVACYSGEEAGFFRPHRDNTTKGTAHRRFAVTINLNAGEYDGGELRFPEFGPRTYRPPTGGAVVFSCSLLHEALPVTRGLRYAFLPFLYDEAAAAVRERNNAYLDPAIGEYRAAPPAAPPEPRRPAPPRRRK